MEIYLDNLDVITQERYKEFGEKVNKLLLVYEKNDKTRFDLVKEKIIQTNGNWDTSITLISGDSKCNIDISHLLAYEYCLAGERITNGKVSFENMLEKLFNGVQKFRIGNPVHGMDDECLYGKGFDDKSAVPVTSKKYRIIMGAGAQYLDYFQNGNLTGAVFIYKKERVKGFAKDSNGMPVDKINDGIDFENLTKGQSLLTNLRQTTFHEWNHNSEKEIIELDDEAIQYEYESIDGKKYRNYEKVNKYVTSENIEVQEPDYIFDIFKDKYGNTRKDFFYKDIDGNDNKSHDDFRFSLQEKQLDEEICISTGVTTIEVMPNGKLKMHNQITEGFVEKTARAMIKAIDPGVKDIDEWKYTEHVAIASRVISSRDVSIGDNGQGQTYADFLMHSTILKKDLEDRSITLLNGEKVDGLHYISDYADKAHDKQTPKRLFLDNDNMMYICNYLQLNQSQIQKIIASGLFEKKELTIEQQDELKQLLLSGNNADRSYVDSKIDEYVRILEEEKKFFDGIPEKLGYMDRKIGIHLEEITVGDLGKQTLAEQNDTKLLDKIEEQMVKREKRKTENAQSI